MRTTPHGSETNGIAERAAGRVTEGTSSILGQSGPQRSWWAEAVECYCRLPNLQEWTSVHFTIRWANHSICNRCKNLFNIIKRPTFPGNIQWIRIERVEKLDW